MSLPPVLILAATLGAASATSNGELASWYATRALANELADMQPEVVAKLLSQVEQKWEEMAVADLRNKTEAGASLVSMTESCGKVTKAIVKGSDGDKDRVAEYLVDVCKSASGETVPMCKSFSSVLDTHLSHDVYSNREELDAAGFCTDFYNGAVKEHAKKQAAALDAAEKADAEKAKAEAEARAKAEADAAKAKAAAAAEARKAEANRVAAEVANELNRATDKISQATQTMTQADKRADAINKESKDATDTVDQARKEFEVAAEKEAQAAEKEAEEAQEKVKELRLKKVEEAKKAEEAKRSAEEKAKASAQLMVDAEKKAEANKKAEAETKTEAGKDANVTKKAVLLKKAVKAKTTVKSALRAGK
jgi:DNA repair exonuclease SbcCD ATPase subunit